jgi:hypothetical protein
MKLTAVLISFAAANFMINAVRPVLPAEVA